MSQVQFQTFRGGLIQSQAQAEAAPPAVSAPPPAALPAHGPQQPRLLARYAESIYWLGRYMERMENLARLLDVTRTFARDDRDGRNWLSILRINADEQRFRDSAPEVSGSAVARFYLLACGNPTSICAVMDQVRENARTLRALISTEVWLQINVFHGQIHALTEADIAPPNLSAVCAMLREGVQAHTGIVEGTLYRDQSWSFYTLGRHIERADGMTRLVDIKYAAMLPREGEGSVVDAAQWDILVRAAAGYHAYRRAYPHGYSPADVAGFMLLDGAFPRSVALNLSQLYWHLTQLRTRYGLHGNAAALERLDELRGLLAATPIEELLRRGLPPFLDWMQRQFGLLHDDVAAGFFRSRDAAPADPA